MNKINVFKDYKNDINLKCDICVIGSGAGGAVVARELSDRGFKVILLEEGGHHTKDTWTGRPYDAMKDIYRNGGATFTFGNTIVSVTLGRCIGGTTTINSLTCFRTPSKILKKWNSELGLDNLTEDNLEKYFTRVEKEINVTELSWDVLGNGAKIVKRGADKLGLNCRPLKHNVKNCRGCGTCQWGCIDGAKQSMDVTYIPKALESGAEIFANCRADKVIIKNGLAGGVTASIIDPETGKKKYEMIVEADKVVVSCGSMITPAFLMRSGLKNKNIGRNLQIHPAGRVVALMHELVEGWKGVSQGAYISDFEDEGICLEGIFVPPSLLLAGLPGAGKELKKLAVEYPRLAAFGVMIHDSTTGRVYKGFNKNLILSKYMINKSDLEKMKKGIAYTARIFFAAGAEKVYTAVIKMPVLYNMDDVDKFLKLELGARDFEELLAFHPLATARMASTPDKGATDKYGETFEVKNLYVADGSSIPTSLGVNPQLTIMAVSSYIADKMAEKMINEKRGRDNAV